MSLLLGAQQKVGLATSIASAGMRRGISSRASLLRAPGTRGAPGNIQQNEQTGMKTSRTMYCSTPGTANEQPRAFHTKIHLWLRQTDPGPMEISTVCWGQCYTLSLFLSSALGVCFLSVTGYWRRQDSQSDLIQLLARSYVTLPTVPRLRKVRRARIQQVPIKLLESERISAQ